MVDATQSTAASQPESVRSVFRRHAGLAGENAKASVAATGDAAARQVHDTVTLSDGAQKIVNLQRGTVLADEAKTRAVDQDYASFLGDAMADIRRIAKLFNGTFSSFFKQLRGD